MIHCNKAQLCALLLLAAHATFAAAQTDPLERASSTSTDLIPLGPKAYSKFVTGASALKALSAPVTDVKLTNFANIQYDMQFAGTPLFWMGLGQGGCGFGNLLNPNKWPHLMAVSLTENVKQRLGIKQGIGCGACVRITCQPDVFTGLRNCRSFDPIVAVVVDVCPTAGPGQLCENVQVDLYGRAWDLVAHSDNPYAVIERVECPQPDTNIQLYVIRNEGPSLFFKVSFQNVGGSGIIAKADLECDGVRMPMTNMWGGVWQLANQPPSTEYCKFWLTADDGQTVGTKTFTKLPRGDASDAFSRQENGKYWIWVQEMGVQFEQSAAPGQGGYAQGLGGAALSSAKQQLAALGGGDAVAAATQAALGLSNPAGAGLGGAAMAAAVSAQSVSAQSVSAQSVQQQPQQQYQARQQQGAAAEVAPDAQFTCEQQKSWGKCGNEMMRAGVNPACPPQGCCAITCGGAAAGRRLLSATVA